MTEAQESEAPLTSIQARIAALRLEQVGHIPSTPPPTYEQARKSKPPPPPLPKRPASTNNPPVLSNGSASSNTIGNTPAGRTTNGRDPPPPPPSRTVLPAPAMKKWEGRDRVSPNLPPRRPSEGRAVPALPPRRPSELSLTRKQSTDSISSIASGRSSISGYSARAALASPSPNGTPQFRIRAPEYDPANLPPLPERKVKEEETRPALRPMKSVPGGLNRQRSIEPPALPGRPPLPSRNGTASEAPPLPVRRDTATEQRLRKSALEFGFNNKVVVKEPLALPSNRPNGVVNGCTTGTTNGHATSASAGSGKPIELTAATFDDVILRSGKPTFVDFYATFCKYCKEIDPTIDELASRFQYSNINIVKIDSYTHKEIGDRYKIEQWPTIKLFDGRGNELDDLQWNLDFNAFAKTIKRETGVKPDMSPSGLPTPPHSSHGAPPPVPTGSRPNLDQLNKTKPKVGATPVATAASGMCLRCRDFSGPDNHAARFPRESIPSQDPKWLGPQLCNPFPSHTDKARAIFTWLHHNINYDVVAFFNDNVQHSTPGSTMQTGLAVCEGYAALFSAMALAAGLESVVVGGHGKGFGFEALQPGQPFPRENRTGHAWNAVRIDGGAWKLIDPCWGAGNVKGKGQPYNKDFSPHWFTRSNDEFGESHYPENDRYFFRDDGRAKISWHEYCASSVVHAPKPTVFGRPEKDFGFEGKSFMPVAGDIRKHDGGAGPTVRFQWTKICPHYDVVKNHGETYIFMMKVDEEWRFAQTDGYNWWIDVRRDELGEPGSDMSVAYIQKITRGDGTVVEGRGVKEDELKRGMKWKAGWKTWNWSYLARWTVV